MYVNNRSFGAALADAQQSLVLRPSWSRSYRTGNMLRAGTRVNVRLRSGEYAAARLLDDVRVRETGDNTYVSLRPMTVEILRHHLPAGTAIRRPFSAR